MTELLKRQKAAERMGVGLGTVKRLLAEGELEQIRIGRLSFVPADSIEDYIARNRTTATAVGESGDRRLRSVA